MATCADLLFHALHPACDGYPTLDLYQYYDSNRLRGKWHDPCLRHHSGHNLTDHAPQIWIQLQLVSAI